MFDFALILAGGPPDGVHGLPGLHGCCHGPHGALYEGCVSSSVICCRISAFTCKALAYIGHFYTVVRL